MDSNAVQERTKLEAAPPARLERRPDRAGGVTFANGPQSLFDSCLALGAVRMAVLLFPECRPFFFARSSSDRVAFRFTPLASNYFIKRASFARVAGSRLVLSRRVPKFRFGFGEYNLGCRPVPAVGRR